MATLDDLLKGGLEDLLRQDPRALEDSLYTSSAEDINRRSGDTARTINENTFGRGLGLSTITRDLQADRERLRDDALVKARRDSAFAARSAVLQALATAAGQQSADANRRQQANQFNTTQNFNERQGNRQESIANRNLVAQGIGGLGGAALTVGGLVGGRKGGFLDRMLNGGGKSAPDGGGENRLAPGGQSPDVAASFAGDYPSPGEIAPTGDLSIPDFNLGDVGGSFNFDAPDFSGSGGFDPGGFDLFGAGGDSTLDMLLRGGFNL